MWSLSNSCTKGYGASESLGPSILAGRDASFPLWPSRSPDI